MGLRSFTSLRYKAPSLRFLGQLFAILLDELFGDRVRQRGVARELHGELGLALGGRAEDRREAEHVGERDLGLDAREAVAFGAADGDAASLHQDTHDTTLEL